MVGTFLEEFPPLVVHLSALPCPAAPRVNPRKGATARLLLPPVVVHCPPADHSPGEGQLLENINKWKICEC